MTDTIPEWALKEACKRSGLDWHAYHDGLFCDPLTRDPIKAAARTIAKYETPPVDPVRAEAERMWLAWEASPTFDGTYLDLIEAALRRGAELRGEGVL